MGLDADIYKIEKKYEKEIENGGYIGEIPNEEIIYFRKFYELNSFILENGTILDDEEYKIEKELLDKILDGVKTTDSYSYGYDIKLEQLKDAIEKMKQIDFDKYTLVYSYSC